jgi:hypothetical protein
VKPKPEHGRTLIHRIDEIPSFTSEEEERAFWETHEVSDELAARAEPLPEDVVALLDHIRERRAQHKSGVR